MKVVDPRSIDFINAEDYEYLMAREYRITDYKCLLGRLEVDGHVLHAHI
jgi:hypothetical protein